MTATAVERNSSVAPRLKGNPNRGLAAATWGFFVGFAAVAFYGPAAKEFKELMGLSGFTLGLLVAAPQLTGSLLRIPFGAWVDKAGGKKPLLILLGLSLLGMAGLTLLLSLVDPHGLTRAYYPLVLILGFLSGSAVATFSVGIPQTSYWFPRSRQGWALGTYGGLGNTAPGLFTLLLPFALVGLGLAGAYAIWFAFLLVGTSIYWLVAHDAYYFQLRRLGHAHTEAVTEAQARGEELFPSGNVLDALKTSARVGRTWALVALYFTSFGGFLALTSWLPSYWSFYLGVNARAAGVLTAVFFSLVASFVRIGGGTISDRIGGERTAIGSYALVLAGALVLVFSRSFAPSIVGEILIAIGMGVGNAAVFKLVSRYVPQAVGGASGWVGGLGAFGGFIVPPLLGIFADSFGRIGYARGFLVYVALAAVSILISIRLAARRPRRDES